MAKGEGYMTEKSGKFFTLRRIGAPCFEIIGSVKLKIKIIVVGDAVDVVVVVDVVDVVDVVVIPTKASKEGSQRSVDTKLVKDGGKERHESRNVVVW